MYNLGICPKRHWGKQQDKFKCLDYNHRKQLALLRSKVKANISTHLIHFKYSLINIKCLSQTNSTNSILYE